MLSFLMTADCLVGIYGDDNLGTPLARLGCKTIVARTAFPNQVALTKLTPRVDLLHSNVRLTAMTQLLEQESACEHTQLQDAPQRMLDHNLKEALISIVPEQNCKNVP